MAGLDACARCGPGNAVQAVPVGGVRPAARRGGSGAAVTAHLAASEERARQAELNRVRVEEHRKRGGATTLVGAVFACWSRPASASSGLVVAKRPRERRTRPSGRGRSRAGEGRSRDGPRRRAGPRQVRALRIRSDVQVAHQSGGRTTPPRPWHFSTARNDLRGWEWRYVHRLCHSELIALRGTPATCSPRCSPRRLPHRHGQLRQAARLWNAKTGPNCSPSRGTPATSGRVVQPGRYTIVTASEDKTAAVEREDGGELLALRGTQLRPGRVVQPGRLPHPHHQHRQDGPVVDAKTGAELLVLKARQLRAVRVVLPRRLLGRHRQHRQDGGCGTRRPGPNCSPSRRPTTRSASFSPDGSRIVTASSDGTARSGLAAVQDTRPPDPDREPAAAAGELGPASWSEERRRL